MVLSSVDARTHRQYLAALTDERARPLVEAHDGPRRVVRLGVHVEHALHRGHERRVLTWRDGAGSGPYPAFDTVRPERVFF